MSDPNRSTPMPLLSGNGPAAQVAEAAVMAVQMWVRAQQLRERAESLGAGRDQPGSELWVERERARSAWAPALEPGFGESASTADAMGAWAAAQTWAADDPEAARAVLEAGARLARLHPDLVDNYEAFREAGLSSGQAMLEAGRAVAAPDWENVLDPSLRQNMTADETLQAWEAARPWAASAPQEQGLWSPRSEQAAQAMGEAEARLRVLEPAAMADYDEARSFGASPLAAMNSALGTAGDQGPAAGAAASAAPQRGRGPTLAERAYPNPLGSAITVPAPAPSAPGASPPPGRAPGPTRGR